MITADNFTMWLSVAPTGESFTYHTTDRSLASDRVSMPNRPAIPGLDALATAAWDAEVTGKVALLQRRRSGGGFQYLAIRLGRAPAAAGGGIGRTGHA